MAAKQTSYDGPLSPEQEVWLLRAKRLAETMQVAAYSPARLEAAIEKMHELLRSPDDARHVPKLLADAGVRFVVVERLPGLKIDGVCCVPETAFNDFVRRKGPLFTDTNVRQFAHYLGLHSGIVAGRLRMHLSRGPLGQEAWKRFVPHLARVRHVITGTALVDGFGSTPHIS